MAETKSQTKASGRGRKMVLREKKVDAFTTLRTRVPLTPAVCERCGFDITERNDLGPYEELSPEQQEQVKAAMKQHEEMHTVAENRVIDEEDIPKEWNPKSLGKAGRQLR